MYSYSLLETNCYYLIQEKAEGPISLIKVNMDSDYCLFLTRFGETEITEWRRKDDTIHEILELLSDEKIKVWQAAYYSNEDAFYEDGEE
ncbi:hypothetical protein [Flavihumibacter profundi]|jgi:hypothetical protein|uniref:hypothetical protein n=1 Tax=Flavihumibacter profundi TaxID=2716883 RepID=UPI001CC42DB1|nr:hypothetical protein [Flavihumibacter profundi]MBZ5856285.1 hypothetical protein [Flavihumibacter profundi]